MRSYKSEFKGPGIVSMFAQLALVLVLSVGNVMATEKVPENTVFKCGDQGVQWIAGAVSLHQHGMQFRCFSGVEFRHVFKDAELEKAWRENLSSGRVIPVVLKANFQKRSGSRNGVATTGGLFLYASIIECREVAAEDICAEAQESGISKEVCDGFLNSVTMDAMIGEVGVSLGRVFKGASTQDGGSNIMSRSLRIANPTDAGVKVVVVGMEMVKDGRVETLKISPNKDQSEWEVPAQSFHDDFISFVSYASLEKGEKAEVTLKLRVNDAPVEVVREVTW